jgi:hypothetical protein
MDALAVATRRSAAATSGCGAAAAGSATCLDASSMRAEVATSASGYRGASAQPPVTAVATRTTTAAARTLELQVARRRPASPTLNALLDVNAGRKRACTLAYFREFRPSTAACASSLNIAVRTHRNRPEDIELSSRCHVTPLACLDVLFVAP